jgi:predicted Zn-dependent protease
VTFTATTDQHGTHTVYCRGANHSDYGVRGTCDDCGANVIKIDGKSGYANAMVQRTGYYCFNKRHECDPAKVARRAAERAAALADGQIIKGATVEVIKGRKVPVGTVGVVFWTGTDGYGTDKVGLRGDDGQAHFTAVNNVRPKLAS